MLSSVSSSALKVSSLLAVVAIVLWAFPMRHNTFSYRYAEGKLWRYPALSADFDFPIYKTDTLYEREKAEALRSYVPCFTQSGRTTTPYIVSATDMEMLREGGFSRLQFVNNRHIARLVDVSEVYTPRTAYEAFHREWGPNLVFDTLTSRNLYESLLLTVSPTEGAVMAGEKIIEYGEVITSEKYLVIRSLEKAYSERGISRQRQWISLAATGMLLLLFIGCFGVYLYLFRKPLWKQKRVVLFFSLLTALMSAGSALVIRFFPATPSVVYLLPLVWIPILVRVFFDSNTAFLLHLTNVFIISLIAPEPFLFLLMQVPAGLVAVVALKDLTRRSQLALTAIYVLAGYSLVYTVYHLIVLGTLTGLSWHPYVCFTLNAVLIIGVYSLIYIFEKAFRLLSSVTLIELSNLNSDLMHTFADKAPGTFQHSLQVSSLASDAAKSIGAKALLVRTAALYHDIGKMSHPERFTENQAEGHNPLLQMSNRDAAQAVISHVAEGERLARQHSLPETIIRFIRSHHGDSLVRYFYNSEVNRLRKENPEAEKLIRMTDYRYPGPRPSTKEEAILMMADAVEARARSLDQVTEESLREMVEQMVGGQMQSGQFALTPLTFNDVERIKQSFCDRLLSIYHHRIQYPTIEEKR